MSIRYWYDQTNQKLIVQHCASRKTKVIKRPAKIDRFCKAQGTTLEECKQVQTGEDHLGMFNKPWKLWKW
ncbi:MAG: hypothetical protein WB502_07605 [Thermoactinomyces sp.]